MTDDCTRCGAEANHLHGGKPYCELCRGCYDEPEFPQQLTIDRLTPADLGVAAALLPEWQKTKPHLPIGDFLETVMLMRLQCESANPSNESKDKPAS